MPPAKKRPNETTGNNRQNGFEIYDIRPLIYPWTLISLYEFMRAWTVEPLLVPTHHENLGVLCRTEWTRRSLKLRRSDIYKAGEVAALPGRDYVAVTATVGN